MLTNLALQRLEVGRAGYQPWRLLQLVQCVKGLLYVSSGAWQKYPYNRTYGIIRAKMAKASPARMLV